MRRHFKASQLALLFRTGVEGESAVADKFYDHGDHVSFRKKTQKLAGKVTMSSSIVSCCEIDKHSTGPLFSRKGALNFLN